MSREKVGRVRGFMDAFKKFLLVFLICHINFIFTTQNFQEDEFERIVLGEDPPPHKIDAMACLITHNYM
jgi:hypothetical protein